MAFDSQGRLFVADRSNSRIQIFDSSMKFVAEWRQFGRPSGLVILKDDTLVTADWESGRRVGRGYADWPGKRSAQSGEATAIRNPGFIVGPVKPSSFGVPAATIRIGNARTGSIVASFETAKAEGIGADAMGNIYTGPAKYIRAK